MVNKIKASIELSLLTFILIVTIIAVGVYGVNEIKELNIVSQKLYLDRMIPADQLGSIRHHVLDIDLITNKVPLKEINFNSAKKQMGIHLDSIQVIWSKYNTTSFTELEKINSSKVNLLLKKLSATIIKLNLSLERNDIKAFNDITKNDFDTTAESLINEVDNLIFLQVKEGKNIFENSFVAYNASKQKITIVIILIFAFSIPLFYYLLKKNRAIISVLNYKDRKLVKVQRDYRDFIDYAGDAILIFDSNAKVVDLNEYACNLFGYSREELLQLGMSDLICTDDAVDVELVEQNKSKLICKKAKRKDGTFIDTEITNCLMEGSGSFAIVRDVTDRKKSEALVKESEEKYRYLFDNNPAHVIIWDIDTLEVLKINKGTLEKFGYSEAEWENMSVLDFRPVDEQERFKAQIQSRRDSNDKVFRGGWRYVKKNGEEMFMDVTIHKMIYENRNAVLSLALDITEQVKAEKELRQSEEKYHYLFDNNPADILIWDLDTLEVLEVNNSILEKYGYTQEDWDSMTILDYRPEEEHQSVKDSIQWIHQSNRTFFRSNLRHLKKNGEELTMDVFSHKISYNDKNAIISIARDITEHIKAEQELRQSEEKYRYLFDNNPAHIIIWDLDTLNVLEVNGTILDNHGYSKEEWTNMTILDNRYLKDYYKTYDFVDLIKTNEKSVFETSGIYLKKNGEEMVMNVTSHVIVYDNKKAILSLGHDVTEQIKAKNELEQSEEKYHSLIEHAGDAIFMLDANKNIIEANSSASQLLGYSKEEFLTMKTLDVYPLDKSDYDAIRWNFIEDGKAILTETSLQRKDGSIVEVEINRKLLNNGCYLSIVRDISKRKLAEAELIENRELLKLFIEHSPASLAMFDNEMRYIATSNKFLQNNRITSSLIGKCHYDVFPLIGQQWKDVHQRCLAGATEKNDEEMFIWNGKIEWIKWEIHPWKRANGEIGGIILFDEIITEKKEATEMFKYQFVNSPDTISIIDREFKVVNVNRDSMTGLSVNEMIGADCISLLPEQSQSIARENLERCFEKIENQQFEIELSKGRWGSFRLVPIAPNGEVTHIMAFNTDITSQKHAEQKILQSEERYRALTENISDGIILVNDRYEIEYQSPSSEIISGYGLEEVKYKELSDFIHPDEHERYQEFMLTSTNSPSISIESQFRIINKEGEIIWVEGSIVNLLQSKNIGSFVINYRDITSRKKLEEQQALMSLIVNSSNDAIISTTLDGIIKTWNVGAERILGYSAEETIGKHVMDLKPLELHEEEMMILETVKNGNSIENFESKRIKKNGDLIDVSLTISPIKDSLGNVVGTSGSMRDITERKKTEAELFENKERLSLFIKHIPLSLAMFDKDMNYIAHSDNWLIDYGVDNNCIKGKNHYEIFPETIDRWKPVFDRCLEGNIENSDEEMYIRHDGKAEWMRWEIRPWHLASGQIGGVIMYAEVITERKKATEMFKYQFDNSPDGILYVNKDLKIENINIGASIGYSIEDLIGVDCVDILLERSRPFVRERLNKCFENAENQEFEFEVFENIWAGARLVPLVSNSEVTHIMIFVTDITNRKLAEQKLLQSEERYRALTENISDAIVLVNKDFELEYISPTTERISGYSASQAKSKLVFDFIHPDDVKVERELFAKAYNSPGVPFQKQNRIINSSGKAVWVEGTIVNLLDNNHVESYVINFRDITSRKELEEKQALMALIVNSSDDAIISKSIDGIITSWNVGAQKILGYTAFETIGKHISMLVPIEYRNEEAMIIETIKKGKSVEHFETKRRKKNGDLIDVSLTISPVKDNLGNVVGASKIMRDITERKKTDEELIRYNTELKKANSELDRFVYSASHDLRAPLKSILGLVSITKEIANPKEEQLMDCLGMLNNSVLKLDNFIDDILSYSRNSRMELDRDIIDFKVLIEKIRESYQFIEGINDFDVQITNCMEDIAFVGDAKRISVILNNIVTNAFKYRDKTKDKSYLKVHFTCNKTSTVIKFEDNGIGISNKDQEKIFNMFYRATMLSTGSGLGLYIVKETIDKLQGTITVKSELGKGTIFVVEIPNQIAMN